MFSLIKFNRFNRLWRFSGTSKSRCNDRHIELHYWMSTSSWACVSWPHGTPPSPVCQSSWHSSDGGDVHLFSKTTRSIFDPTTVIIPSEPGPPELKPEDTDSFTAAAEIRFSQGRHMMVTQNELRSRWWDSHTCAFCWQMSAEWPLNRLSKVKNPGEKNHLAANRCSKGKFKTLLLSRSIYKGYITPSREWAYIRFLWTLYLF